MHIRHNLRRPVLAIGAAVIAAASLVACSPGDAEKSADTLTIWYNAGDQDAFKDVFTRYEEASGVKVELVAIPADGFESQVTTRWAAGDRPDILEYHTNPTDLNPKENMIPLTDEEFVSKSGNIYDAIGRIDGVVYAAITGAIGQFGIYYNRELFAKHGLEAPENYADLANICKVLLAEEPGIIPIWESGASQWPTQILGGIMYSAEFNEGASYTKSLLAQEAKLSDPDGPLVQALTQYQALADSGCFGTQAATQKFEDSVSAVTEGRAGLVALADGFLPQFEEAAGGEDEAFAKVGWATPSATKPVAAFAGGPQGTYFAPKTGNAAREAAALDFIRWATGEGYQETVNQAQIAPIIEGNEVPPALQKGLRAEMVATLNVSNILFTNDLVGFANQFPTTSSSVLTGQMTPQEAGDISQQQLEQGAKAQGLPGW